MPDTTRERQPRRLDLAGVLYNLMMTLLSPVLLLWVLVRLLRGKRGGGLAERLGWLPAAVIELGASADPVLWVHCASVGEVNAAAPILRELRVRVPLAHIVLSTMTATAQDAAQKRDLGVDAIFYFPLDAPLIVERVLDGINPTVLVLVETELWPNLLWLARRRGTRTMIVNGRISDRAYPRNRALLPVFRWALSHADLIGAQSQLDAERFIGLGADPAVVSVGGNSKFDEVPIQLLPAEAARWRQEFGFAEDDEVLLAGSTHEGEEEIILSVFDHLRFSHKRLQLIIAPRHPERGDRVHQLVREHGYDVYRRSHVLQAREAGEEIGPPGDAAVRVPIIDTIGELASLYGCADLVIVGGSLVKGLSGHNLLEPIAQGKLALFGRYVSAFRDISAIAVREGCGIQVQTAEELQEQCDRLLNNPEERTVVVARGERMLTKYAGASARYAQAVAEMVEPSADLPLGPVAEDLVAPPDDPPLAEAP
jgi:3-deoxy-D-manno-octulosonic-acid transferase